MTRGQSGKLVGTTDFSRIPQLILHSGNIHEPAAPNAHCWHHAACNPATNDVDGDPNLIGKTLFSQYRGLLLCYTLCHNCCRQIS